MYVVQIFKYLSPNMHNWVDVTQPLKYDIAVRTLDHYDKMYPSNTYRIHVVKA